MKNKNILLLGHKGMLGHMVKKYFEFKKQNIKTCDHRWPTNNLKKYEWLKNYPLLKSFTKSFKYSYSKKDINKYKFYKDFRLIGMGGSILGTEAIYQL